MLSHAGRLEDEVGVLLIFMARRGKLLLPPHPFLVPFRDVEGATVKGQTKITVGGKGLQTCQSVVVSSGSNPDWLGNYYPRWMISASRLK